MSFTRRLIREGLKIPIEGAFGEYRLRKYSKRIETICGFEEALRRFILCSLLICLNLSGVSLFNLSKRRASAGDLPVDVVE
jgi:hypothetical protein